MSYPAIVRVLAVSGVAAVAPIGAGQAAGFLVVANKGDHAVGFIDTESGKQVAVVDEGGITGHELIASPDGRTIYVPIYGNSGVGKPGTDGQVMVAIDAATRKITGRLDFGKGVRPHCAQFDAKRVAYVFCDASGKVAAINTSTCKVERLMDAGKSVDGLAWVAGR